MATCYRHPSRETGVSCSNCGRPICPDCMTPTPVGMRCPECSSQRTKVVRARQLAKVPRVTYALIASGAVTSWKAVGAAQKGAGPDSVLADIPAAAFQGAPLWQIRVVVTHNNGATREARFRLNLS